MRKVIHAILFAGLLVSCEMQDFLYKYNECSISKIKEVAEKDSVESWGKVFFHGDTVRTDTINLTCKESEILSVSRRMQIYHTVSDSTDIGVNLINLKGTPYKLIVISGRKGIERVQYIYAQGILPEGKVGYTLSGTGDVASRNPFLKNKKVVTTDKLPKLEVQRIHNTAKAMKKETSYPTGKRELKQYSGNGLYYIAEENGLVWGVWLIGNVTPPKGDIS